MNKLSWIIYAADAIPSIGAVIGAGASMFIMFYVIWSIVVSAATSASWHDENQKYLISKRRNSAWKVWPFGAAISLILITALMPSSQTMYMVAGSEAGEYVASTDQGQRMIDNVIKVVDLRLEALINGDLTKE